MTAVVCTSLALTASAETEATDTLDAVVVTGTRQATDARLLPLTVTSINRETLTEQSRMNILPTVVEQTPGLFASSRGMMGYGVSTGSTGNMKVRGIGGGAQMLVLIDGQPQYAGLMGHPIADAYQSMMAEKVEVLRGPASLLYGSNAMGGVMNIVTRQSTVDGQSTSINLGGGSYGTIQAEATNEARKGRFSSVAGISYQRTDGHLRNSDFGQVSGFLKLGVDITSHWKASADANLTHFNFSNPGGEQHPMVDYDGKITRGLASMSLSNRYGRTQGTLRGFYDWGHHNINDGYCPSLPDNLAELGLQRLMSIKKEKTDLYKHNDYIAGLTWYQTAEFFRGNSVTVGLDWQQFGGKAWNEPMTGGSRTFLTKQDGKTVDHITQDEVGAYADFRQDVCRWLTLDAGVRFSWHSQTGSEWIPQGGASLHITKDADIKAIVSKGYRNPTISEMFMFNVNQDLKPERLMSYEVSFVQRFRGGHVGASIFFIDGKDIISLRMGQSYQNQASVRNHGLELSGQYNIGKHWSLDANYSYLHMHETTEGAPEHKAYAGARCQYGKWTLTAGLQHIQGLTLTTLEPDTKENYTLLNASASYQPIRQLRLWVRGENLLAQEYATYCFVNRFYNFGRVMAPRATVMAGININL